MNTTTTSDYQDFLRQKIKMATYRGFTVQPDGLHHALYQHQRDIVRWAVHGGNRAIFASFGLGKSVMQCEWLRQMVQATLLRWAAKRQPASGEQIELI